MRIYWHEGNLFPEIHISYCDDLCIVSSDDICLEDYVTNDVLDFAEAIEID